MTKQLLVTGGAGFIGSNFVRHLLHGSEAQIVVLDALTYAGNLANLEDLAANFPARFSFIHGDIADSKLLDTLCQDLDPDNSAIINFAAHSHNDNSLKDPEPFIQSNIVGTFCLLEVARKFNLRLHHISTDEVFGDLDFSSSLEFTETSRYQPSSPYSASKAAADHLVNAWVRSFGIKATISNCSNNFGPYQHVEKFIPRQITQLLLGQKPVLYGSGQNVRDWIYVDDHSRAVKLIVEQGKVGETYLVGARQRFTNFEVLQMLLEIFAKPADYFVSVSDRPGHDRKYALDPSKLEQDLAWRPEQQDFKQSLQTTVQWYAEHEAWWLQQKKLTEERYATA